MNTSVTRVAFVMVAGLLGAGTAFSDVTIEQSVKVEAGGMMSMMASEGTVTSSISGNKSRSDNNVEAKSSLIKRFAKNMNSSTIILLDEELMLNLVPEEEQYSELTFAQVKEQMEEGMQALEGSGGESGSLPVSEDECEWSDPELNVNHTGEKQRFGGVKAEQHIITASQTCTVPDTGKSCEMTWNLEYWNAKRMPGHKEATAFQKNLALKLGGDEMLAMAQASSRGLLAMFKKGWGDVMNETEQMKGFAAKTVMSMEIGGESCTTTAGQPIAMDDLWSNAAEAGVDAAGRSAASHAGSKVAEESAEALGDSVGGSIAGSAIGAASRELATGLFKKFGKKKKKKKEAEPVAAADPASGSVVLFKITSELTAVNEDAVAASRFTVPAGWKKVKATGF